MVKFLKAYFWEVIRFHYADFKGRASRRQWAYFCLLGIMITVMIIVFIHNIIFMKVTLLLSFLLLLVPELAMNICRLHDANLSGWWYICWRLLFISSRLLFTSASSRYILVLVEYIILFCLPSVEPNKFDRKEKKLEKMDEFLGNVQWRTNI
ncbi:MAG: DUF805 domain-containing protein [Endomicrobium sp.]|jgi:uncharacterized membrane protein YhaH (DUF805 family)|nr:DUF805 domain-containing protein [Endomicrobium sp.]